MRYTVIWEDDPLNELADIWLRSPNRAAVTAAAARIEHLLRWSPETQGQAYNGDRLLGVAPLEVVFTVSTIDRLVRVLAVYCLP